MSELRVSLDLPLPDTIAVGAGTAVFVAGWCAAPGDRVVELAFLVDGAEQPVAASGMPRLDVSRDVEPDGYASGFWGTVRITRAPCVLALRARLADGTVLTHELARMEAAEPVAPLDGDPTVAVCMATFNPRADLFRAQIESLRAQTLTDWLCVISDDGSDAAHLAEIEAAVAGDERFAVSRAPRRAGFYRNFERALSLAPAGARFVAMADQDDAWHPDKLATLVGALGDAQLVYSDARVVGPDGAVIADTYWERRRPNHEDLTSLLSANAITGAASLFPRALLDVALPFPPAQFAHFHDHWIGLCARARGRVAYVDRPLYDYVQHGGAVLGHAAANRVVGVRERLGTLREDPRGRIRLYRAIYFVDVARLTQMATILLMRTGPNRTLERFLRADRSVVAALRLWAHGAREYVGRPETLGAERGLAYAFLWRRALQWTARERPQRFGRLDALPPDDFAPQPGARRPAGPAGAVAAKIAPLALDVRADAPQRVNLLIPTVDLKHLFGGYIGKFNLARRLAERGLRVRIVTVDPTPPLPPGWQAQVAAYEGLGDVFERVEVAFGRSGPLTVSPDDRWIATTWWTAHIAAAASETPFLYLIQEYEPFTFPMGTWAALAEQSYRFPHTALYSTELLRGYFRNHGIGVADDERSASFQNAITAVAPPPDLATRTTRRLLFYARPEPHAARNLFELGVMALERAVAAGTLSGWELRGIGTTSLGRRVTLAGGAEVELLGRPAQADYAGVVGEHDAGLALMHTPHPSLVPIEMAAGGLAVVTSAFEHKTAEAMAAISPNLIAAEPTVEGVAAALAEAVGRSPASRLAGADVRWARTWSEAFPDALMARVEAWLR